MMSTGTPSPRSRRTFRSPSPSLPGRPRSTSPSSMRSVRSTWAAASPRPNRRARHGTRGGDAGPGAGFPGLPLALCNPARHFTLIDSTAKKIRFVSHAAHTLGLTNVTAVHARAESLKPEAPFDTVVVRALAPLPQMLAQVAPLCGAKSRVLAMKGRWPTAELAALPAAWRLAGSRELKVPGLAEARCVLVLALALD